MVTVELQAAGTVESYTEEKKNLVRGAFADSLGVDLEDITVTVRAASVIISVEVAAASTAAAATMQSSLATSMASPAAATSFLAAAAITVETAPVVVQTTALVVVSQSPPSPPPPAASAPAVVDTGSDGQTAETSPAEESNDSTLLVIILVVAIVVILLLLVGVALYMRSKKMSERPKFVASEATTLTPSKTATELVAPMPLSPHPTGSDIEMASSTVESTVPAPAALSGVAPVAPVAPPVAPVAVPTVSDASRKKFIQRSVASPPGSDRGGSPTAQSPRSSGPAAEEAPSGRSDTSTNILGAVAGFFSPKEAAPSDADRV